MSLPKVTLLAASERDQYLDSSFNPPKYSAEFTPSDFSSEWYSIQTRVREVLGRRWKHGLDGEFCFDELTGTDRLMGLEVLDSRMLVPQIVDLVRDVLQEVESDYSVDICNSKVLLRQPDGSPYPEFNVFVEKTRILVYSEDPRLLALLGLQHEDR